MSQGRAGGGGLSSPRSQPAWVALWMADHRLDSRDRWSRE
ncbi:hypothetical protein C4K04_3364 [Pseudomonas chlororaphis]|uniref:Uncharacterized protein n=1 Tax=Pseudomonas chlororaphis TaxID=587753 RepID=A0A3G7TS08_9PSED|nr:hypothetical protein C4K04_3364 [Pseudomonas chlororaphis]